MRDTAYAWHMLYVHKLPIDMFYDLDDLEVIVDTQTLDPSDPRALERLYVVRPISTAAQHTPVAKLCRLALLGHLHIG